MRIRGAETLLITSFLEGKGGEGFKRAYKQGGGGAHNGTLKGLFKTSQKVELIQ